MYLGGAWGNKTNKTEKKIWKWSQEIILVHLSALQRNQLDLSVHTDVQFVLKNPSGRDTMTQTADSMGLLFVLSVLS